MKPVASISGTCLAWYKLANDTPSLWTHICVAPGSAWGPYGLLTRLSSLRRHIMRCGALSLKVDFNLPEVDISYKRPDPRPLYAALLSRILEEHSHIERLRIKTFTPCCHDGSTRPYCIHGITDIISPWLKTHVPPLLKDLAIDDEAKGGFACGFEADKANKMTVPPSLELLKIHGSLVTMISPTSWPALKDLHLMGSVWQMSDVMDVLKTCDRLENLTIEFSCDRIRAIPALTLPSLRSLALYDAPSPPHDIPLVPLHTPALQHLVVGSGPFRYRDLVSLLGDAPIHQDLALDFTGARIDGNCLDWIIKSCSRITALSFGDNSLVGGPTNAPLQTLIEYVQRRDSSLSRLSVQGIGLNHRRSTMDEWKTLERLAGGMVNDTYIESVQLKFKQTG
jgi:hypothetical protein